MGLGLGADAQQGPAGRLAHVRWIAGGTGAGKSTLTRALHERFDLTVFDGDRAERRWLERCTPERHPYFTAMRDLPPGATIWDGRTPEEVFQNMGSTHGETVELAVEDLLGQPADRIVLVDFFGNLPGDLARLLSWPGQALFLVPTPEFRRTTLTARYADPARARANWGDRDVAEMLAKRLARDALWDAEVRRQAEAHGLADSVLTIDGSLSTPDLAALAAERFRLGEAQ